MALWSREERERERAFELAQGNSVIGNYTVESTQMVDDGIGASLAVHVDAQHNHTLRVLRILVLVLEKKKEK